MCSDVSIVCGEHLSSVPRVDVGVKVTPGWQREVSVRRILVEVVATGIRVMRNQSLSRVAVIETTETPLRI